MTTGAGADGAGVAGFFLSLINTTVAGNHTEGWAARGGGILAMASLLLSSGTVTDNWSEGIGEGGGGIVADSANPASTVPITLVNSIVIGNLTGLSVPMSDTSDNLLLSQATLTSQSSILGDATLNAASVFARTESLTLRTPIGERTVTAGLLADNGGPTETVALLAGGLADGTGDAGLLPAGLDTDQRGAGFDRISGGLLDIGAFEIQRVAACPDQAGTRAGLPVAIDVLGNDAGATRHPVLIEGPAHGTAPLMDDDRFLFIADPGHRGTDSFTYEAASADASARARVGIAVAGWPEAIAGRCGPDRLQGTGGSDALFGHHGDDVLEGGAGADLLEGGAGHDLLRGGAGRDVLIGGGGADRLIGGAGADMFVLTGGAPDRILDFDFAGGDRLALADPRFLRADGTLDGAHLGIAFRGHDLRIRGDLDGDGVGDHTIATLSHVSGLTLEDLVLNAVSYDLT